MPDRLDAEEDQVGGPGELHRGEDLRRPLHHGADSERDGDELHAQAELVADHGDEREYVTERHHGPHARATRTAAPANYPPPGRLGAEPLPGIRATPGFD